MNRIALSNIVRLLRDVPTLWLRRGDVGIVRSVWISPVSAYEVEFHAKGQSSAIRSLLFSEQLEVVEAVAAET